MHTEITREKVISVARSYLGVEFKHQGRNRSSGIDCVGLLICVANEIGYTNQFNYTNYRKTPNPRIMRDLLKEHLEEISILSIVPGDIVYMSFKQYPIHVGIITKLENSESIGLIHSFQEVGKCVEHSIDQYWTDRFVAAFRFRGIDKWPH